MRLEQVIAAEPVVVWSVISDIDGAPELFDAVTSIHRLGEGSDYDVGTRWSVTRKVYGRSVTQEWAVASCEYPQWVETRATSHGIDCRSVHELSPEGTGTLLRHTFWVSPASRALGRSVTHRVVLPVVLRAVEQTMRSELAMVAVESVRRQRIS